MDVDQSFKLGAVVTHTTASTIDVASGKTLTLNDNTANQNIDIGARKLTIEGGGTIAITADVRMNNAASVIQMDDANTYLNAEIVTSADSTVSGAGRVGSTNVNGLLLTNSVRIKKLSVENKIGIDITNGQTARIDSIVIGDGSAANTSSALIFVTNGGGGTLNATQSSYATTLQLKKGSLDVDKNTTIGLSLIHI